MKDGWQRLPFQEVVSDETGGNAKTPQGEFLPIGQLPIVDQGKTLISGYTNNSARICKAQLPVIIFGDYTRCLKFVDFPFGTGADGVKVLRPRSNVDEKYLFHFLCSLHLPSAGYDRHFKYLKRTEIVLPPTIAEQKRIAAILDKAEELRGLRRKALEQLNTLTQSIFLEMFGDPETNPKKWHFLSLANLVSEFRYGLSKRLFTARLKLLSELDKRVPNPGVVGEQASTYGGAMIKSNSEANTEGEVRQAISNQLQTEVAAMNPNNFIVRPKRQLVETYTDPQAWQTLQSEQVRELAANLAGLPTELPTEVEEAKRFDLLMLRLQLARLQAKPEFVPLSQQVRVIAASLEEKDSISMVREQMELIQEIQSDAWWEDVTVPLLEHARKRPRALVRLIEKTQRQPIYTDFKDELGSETLVEIPNFGSGNEFDRFRAKARQFLLAHQDHLTIHKVRFNQPLTTTDLDELERNLLESGIGTFEHLEYAKETSQGLGLFIRSLVGLDREAAKQAFGQFLSGCVPSADQIEFISLIIDHLTHHGIMNLGLLYESPFTDINTQGPEGVFSSEQIDSLICILDKIRDTVAA